MLRSKGSGLASVRLVSIRPAPGQSLPLTLSTPSMARGASLLALLIVVPLFALDERLARPLCDLSGDTGTAAADDDDLRVMMVADLLLLGSDASWLDSWFRDRFFSRLFTNSFRSLKPDMLMVLGDISATGSKLTDTKWSSVMQQFYGMLGPQFSLPLHVLPGDRDMGRCSDLRTNIVGMTEDHVPSLNSAGCSAFEIANVSFVSLNSMSLVCDDDELRFGVEKVVERESYEFQRRSGVAMDRGSAYVEEMEMPSEFQWRENGVRPGTGPVVLLHLPLHQPDRLNEGAYKSFLPRQVDVGPYELTQTLPENSTEYIVRALKPRVVFSAHAHRFSDKIHADCTREITVPAMTWATNEKPGFVFVTFSQNNATSVTHCILAREWHVLAFDCFLLLCLLAIALVVHRETFGKMNSF